MDIEIRIDGEETVIQLYQMIILMFFGHGSVNIYGYNSFENDRVLHMFEGDAFSGDENKKFW